MAEALFLRFVSERREATRLDTVRFRELYWDDGRAVPNRSLAMFIHALDLDASSTNRRVNDLNDHQPQK
jgi:hypothetical protein